MQDILLNVLFILFLLLTTQLFLETRGKRVQRWVRGFIIYLASSAAILFCMHYSITVSEEYRFDLRAAPFILGGFFGGPLVSVGLFLTMIAARFILGFDSGFWGVVLNYGVLLIPLVILNHRYSRLSNRQRMAILLSVILLHVAWSRVVYTVFFHSGVSMSLFVKVNAVKLVVIMVVGLFAEGMLRGSKLREEQELMEKMQLVSHLSASISHEVRNGLTSAHGFFQLLRKKETDPLKLQYIEYALDELNRTEQIVRDFLTFAKPAPKEVTQIQIDQVLENCIALIEPLANMNSIEIKKFLMPTKLTCDEGLLKQVFVNILRNAVEAMPQGGVLEVHMASDNKSNLIAIKDTGTGMSKEQIQRMGTPYFTTKGQKGTGLGMMVAYRIIQEMRGDIRVYSQLGVGTTFVLHLPRE